LTSEAADKPDMITTQARLLAQQKTFQQVVRFLLMTLLSACLTLALPILFHEVFGVGKEVAVALALAIAFFVNFFTVRIVVFRSAGSPTSEFIRYALTNAAFRISEFLAFFVLHTLLGIYYILVLVFVLGTSFIAKFVFYRFFVFNSPASERNEVSDPEPSR
jgi:putative flippase GtrA